MENGIFSMIPELPKHEDMLNYLNHSAYDELLELDVSRNYFQALYHMDDKYYLPILEGSYKDLYEYIVDNLLHPEDRDKYASLMNRNGFAARLDAAAVPGILESHFRIRGIDRDWRWVDQVLVSGEQYGLPANIVYCYIYDIQNMKDREEGVYSVRDNAHAKPDPLTGLFQKKAFFAQGEKVLSVFSGSWLMISIDLEHFKLFNDWYGWDTGNLVLARIGAGLRKKAEEVGGLAGYLDNDDFALLVLEKDIKIQELYDRIHHVLAEYGVSVGFLPAIGVSRRTGDISIMNFWDQAAMACGKAKENFKNRICWFSTDMLEETEKEYRLISEFQKALENHEIRFHLQPQVHASTGNIVGAEALARWFRKDGGWISPALFVPVLEKYGFVTDLDKFIWEEVASWIRSWLDRGNPLLPVSVNVSQIDIFTINVPVFFESLIRKYDLPWNALKIEITESACAEEPENVSEVTRNLRAMGFPVLMDDFGSGYSSLNMLHELEMDAIKLDARFLRVEKENEEKGIHILESVINMTKTMGLPIIVEGVENAEQRDFLMNLGCRYIQGFYFYKPMPVDDFEKIIRENGNVDLRGLRFKANEEFHVREFLDETVYSDSMLNTILGPVAIYSLQNDKVDIIRYNEQFYEAVNVPDFDERINDIGRFMSAEDRRKLFDVLAQARDDRLNGASVLLNFFRTQGGISRFLIHFYYLGEEGKARRFYGSARDVTEITNLQKHMELISGYFSGCIIFCFDYDGRYSFQVIANGLEEEIGLSAGELEEELNSGSFFERVVPEQRKRLRRQTMEAAMGMDFASYFSMINARGTRMNLLIRADYIEDDSSDVKCLVIITARQGDDK